MIEQKIQFAQIIAQSPKMQRALEMAKKFALLDVPLLIQGETGTGKDLIAKACHDFSQRASQKFIAVNCAGLPDEDAESEMFGRHDESGQTRLGFFEYADGGTVLLDSVGELPLSLQAKLLRFLNDGTFRRVGEEQEHYANVRVICTSQVPLQFYVEQGKMRIDLFHRLNVLTLNLPPLREREEDILPLAQFLVRQICEKNSQNAPPLSEEFVRYLQDYPWQGNVRELYNALYRACCLAQDNHLKIADLGLNGEEMVSVSVESAADETLDQMMNRFEAAILRKFYQQYPSSRKLAARLGVSHTAVANKLRQYGIGKEH